MRRMKMKMKRRKRKKKRSISLLLLAAAFVLPGIAAKKRAPPEPYVLLDGTVFRETGFAFPNAEVVVIPDPAPDAQPPKVKRLQTVSDARGEFAFRLPLASMRYIVKVHAKGYRNKEKSVSVQGEDRLDVTFQLHENSK
jgi:hypothetical protein